MMTFELLRKPGSFSLEFPPSIPGLLLMLGYLVLFGYSLWRHRDELMALELKSWLIFAALVVLIPPMHRFMVVRWGRELVIPPGPMNIPPFISTISLPAVGLIAAIAYLLGPAPALLASLVGGLTWARYAPLIFTDVLALSMWGYLVGALLHQHYRGDIFKVLRQPVASVTLASLITVLLLSLSRLAATSLIDGLRIIDFIVVLWRNELPLWLIVGAGLGAVLQLVTLNPAWRLPERPEVPSFYSRSLSAQFMVVALPLVILSMLFSVMAVTNRSVSLARDQSLDEMRRNAAIAGRNIQQFYLTGRNLIQAFSREPQLLSNDPEVRQKTLDIALRVVPYFQQLLLVQESGGKFNVVAAAPAGSLEPPLTQEEINSLRTLKMVGLGTQETGITQLFLEEDNPVSGYSVMGTVSPGGLVGTAEPEWYLVGRAFVEAHPDMKAALSALAKPLEPETPTVGAGEEDAEGSDENPGFEYNGYVVDESGLVVVHPDPRQLYRMRTFTQMQSQQGTTDQSGNVFETLTPEGEHVLVYARRVETLPLWVVLELPYVHVLRAAQKTAGPLIFVQLAFGLLLSVVIPVLSSRITRPLNSLSQAANRIAQGDLQGEIKISRDDEVAQLGDAFEQMRVRLQERLNDLSLLLDVAQRVSATLNLERGIVPVLEGALTETSGAVARFITVRDGGKQANVYAVGEVEGDLTRLDRALTTALLRRDTPLVVQDLDQAPQVQVSSSLRSLAAFPVRSQESVVAVLWLGSKEPGIFDDARINFLSTLASQAAVLIENARLFQTAEGGRQRLAAILSSTRDAILVVDAEGHLLLTNPAAQRLLSIDHSAVGRAMSELGLPEPLMQALTAQTTTARRIRRYQMALPQSLRSSVTGAEEEEPVPSVEVPLEDGRTFYASVAPIKSGEGLTVGVVVVMRDVTHFKELNEMKSEFVATVSHDLRAPLTFMRGYTTMLSMVGDLNDRQRDYMQRILEGIEQMNGLVGDLLDLRRVEAGVGIRQEPCRLGLIMVEAVEAMRARANSKGVDLRLEPSEGSPTIIGDRTLLRQSISNLVDNAVKYTPSGGEVIVGLDITEDTATIRVSDTGIGIAPSDQLRLFEKFYRIKRRETGSVQGTGLGLALVKSIVERHGGRVWVESALNHGSTFYIQLPLPPEEAAEMRI
ncbi:MAG: ATP-binding protein [Anaerolineae bacterium]